MVRGPRSKHQGPWSTDLEPWIVDSVSRFKLRGSRLVDAEPGYLGWLRDLDRIRLRGRGVGSGWLLLGPRAGDGWEEAAKGYFVFNCRDYSRCRPHSADRTAAGNSGCHWAVDGTTANTSAQRMTEILSLANRKRHDAAVTATMALFMVLQSEDSCFSLSAAPLMPSAVTQNRLAISSAC